MRARLGRRRALLVGAGMAAMLAAAAGPALGAGSGPPAPPSPSCPPGTTGASATTGNGQVVAGYTLTTLAAGFRYELNSPGLLPVGDAQTGTIMEYDVPFTRQNVTGGPVVDSLASPVYPGDTAAHLGTAIATFGGPSLPNYPVLADANYPPSPGHGQSAQFAGGGAVDAQSTASDTAATAVSHVSSTSVGPTLGAASGQASSSTDIGSACVDGVATSETGKITIAGIISVDGVRGAAAARSDGTTGVPAASLNVGKVTVAGQAAYVDKNGVHLASQPAVGSGLGDTVQAQLNKALASAGITVKLITPQTSVQGGTATADSGGLDVVFNHVVPSIGKPPGGTPPIPLINEVVYGAARVSAAATTAPAPGAVPTGGSASAGGSAPSSSGGAPVAAPTSGGDTGGAGVSAPSAPTGSGLTETTGKGGQVFSAAPASRSYGESVPIGWLLAGIAGSIAAIGPMLGYARWQLLEGRA